MSKHRGGFTILEVLVTVFVLSVALVALASVQTAAVGTNYNSQRMTIGAILAQDKLEQLKNLAWDDAQLADLQNNFSVDTNGDGIPDDFNWSNPSDHTNADAPGAQANPIDQNGNHVVSALNTTGYTRVWNVADNVPGPYMKTIAVRVTWLDKSTHAVTVYTIISQN